MKTAVIIPNYNGSRFLPPCMAALDRETTDQFSTIVVDNGSTDGSLRWLSHWAAEDRDRHILLQNPENLGFSSAVNRGIRFAVQKGFSYAILLNNDTEVFPDFVENLVRAMDQDRRGRLFALSSRMLQSSDPDTIDDAGDQYTLLGWQFQRGHGEPEGRFQRPAAVFSACAGAAIYRLSLLSETGLFDEAHFAYLEDIDLSFRARLYGFEIRYEPSAGVLHVGSGTSGSRYNSFKVRLTARNSIYLLYKNMPPVLLLLNAVPLLLGFFIKLLFFWKKGFGREYLSGLREGLRTRRHLKKADFRRVPLRRLLSIELCLLLSVFEYLGQKLREKGGLSHAH